MFYTQVHKAYSPVNVSVLVGESLSHIPIAKENSLQLRLPSQVQSLLQLHEDTQNIESQCLDTEDHGNQRGAATVEDQTQAGPAVLRGAGAECGSTHCNPTPTSYGREVACLRPA